LSEDDGGEYKESNDRQGSDDEA